MVHLKSFFNIKMFIVIYMHEHFTWPSARLIENMHFVAIKKKRCWFPRNGYLFCFGSIVNEDRSQTRHALIVYAIYFPHLYFPQLYTFWHFIIYFKAEDTVISWKPVELLVAVVLKVLH